MTMPGLNEVKRQAFDRVLGATPEAVERAVLRNEAVGERSLDKVAGDLSALLTVSRGEALGVLGVSRARERRNPKMDAARLDRLYSALDLYARVASLIGEEPTPGWFRTPKAALGGARPLDLLETRVGLAMLSRTLSALEDGAFL